LTLPAILDARTRNEKTLGNFSGINETLKAKEKLEDTEKLLY